MLYMMSTPARRGDCSHTAPYRAKDIDNQPGSNRRLSPQDQIPGENFAQGQRIKCYIAEVKKTARARRLRFHVLIPAFKAFV